MSHYKPLLRLRMPDLRLDVVGSLKSAELRFHDHEGSYDVALRGRSWELFEVLLLAQLDASQQHPHRGFRTVEQITLELRDRPFAGEIIRWIDRLRYKLAKAKFGFGRASDPIVAAFRDSIIETTSLGYRLSVPPENIRFSRVFEVDATGEKSSPGAP